ncbi:hypothetical protein AMTRI_Chr05g67130 [Amborella trichopoda]|uniref:VHS domain-containing protein n=1 Tax=Amborella trichopoda TaxID=13333 RepID=U5D117_AMBTC|nr:VHS domain-containing protein At3g16270 [Amborella trichopoda]ERN15072.1 hypothetical protein AMTR_s00056p00039790 [Amborella trichopoda]|eukprot:XP_006853605.1 VHS domain-containing protein At3g16270 [Amborella trichopoda]
MDTSRRAVEAYWRSRMIDNTTTDEDKVTPVYKLEEICDLLSTSHFTIVKEVSEYILKRLEHKSPIVKQKALRLIKYSVGKSGVDFRREMQRHSAAMRQLFHYKGQVDPLKGDALNKAVRDTAHEAVSAIFASDEKLPLNEDINRRIQGFGNTNFEMPSEEKKSFISEVVGLGSASIIQGLNTITAAHSSKKMDNGSYRSPNLRRSLTTETDTLDKYDREEQYREHWGASDSSKNKSGTWSQDSRPSEMESRNGDYGESQTVGKSREERLLETIVTSGGVRLQPTRDAIQVFLVEASKLDALALSHAIEAKLQSHLWQVRMKAACVLESILRNKEEETCFAIVASFFSENKDAIIKCSETPQNSLREKATKVLSLLNGDHVPESKSSARVQSKDITTKAPAVELPDLIDTGNSDSILLDTLNSSQNQTNSDIPNTTIAAPPMIDDLFGDNSMTVPSSSNNTAEEESDPFAGVSFHNNAVIDGGNIDDLFSGLTVDDKQSSNGVNIPESKGTQGLFDLFTANSLQFQPESAKDLNKLVGNLSTGVPGQPNQQINETSQTKHHSLNSDLGSQGINLNPNFLYPSGPFQYNLPPNIMVNQPLASQQLNYGAMGNLFAQQQQLLATMANFANLQQFGAVSGHGNMGFGQSLGGMEGGGYGSAMPDIFTLQSDPVQTRGFVGADSSKKEETRAFDFISDHLSSARDPKRVL